MEKHKLRKLQVFVEPNAQGEIHARAAVDLLNEELGQRVVTIAFNRENADVIVGWGHPRGSFAGYYSPRGKRIDRIVIDPAGQFAQRSPLGKTQLVAHEIGHALGLGHRGKYENLMGEYAMGSNLSQAQQQDVLSTFREGGYKAGTSATTSSGGAPTEYRKVVIEYEIQVPEGGFRRDGGRRNRGFADLGDITPGTPIGTVLKMLGVDLHDLVDLLRRELIRTGSRNTDIFGGRA